MKRFINIIIKASKTDRELVLEALQASKVCKPMNNLRESEKIDGEPRMLLNPHNQKCFNFGWFTYQDFHDWTKGQGKIVKGDTPEEKQKFWEAAIFESEHDYGWAIGYHMKHFGCIDETYKLETKHTYGMCNSIKVPLKITKTNHLEIIAKVFGDICRWYSDTELTYTSHLQLKMDSELMGAKQVLFMLGVGYYGASNIPEEPENLSWVADIAKYKSVYLALQKKGVKIPDYDFIYKKSKGLV